MQHHRPTWAPDEIDMERPSAARMYDYYLGGSNNFAADRELAEASLRNWPDLGHIARANRAYLHRVVTELCRAGIDQFLDLGSGIPSGGCVHDVARTHRPGSRTVYVDSDLVAVAHSTTLLADASDAVVIHADLRDPAALLENSLVNGFLDLSRPVAVLMISVLHFVSEEDSPAEMIAAYRDATAPGSYLAVSHGTGDYNPTESSNARGIYAKADYGLTLRSRAQLAELMDGYDLIEPGLVDMIHWRPDAPDETQPEPLGGDVTRYSMLAAVGRTPTDAAA
ncbi:MAG TPA: SAM-dependent methyltransferase [Actinocrinis sp.]|nr:SAM-dependent methyltransferase [Actinocrinis sp.]